MTIQRAVIIEVEDKDMAKVFEFLVGNGRFAGLPNNRFRIEEHSQEILEKIKRAGITVKIIDGE
ncbi:MAG: hypothetical protein HY520_03355 [Candidatus Aenigmarchaeota archaeon]|nr:hypothetical protein [Candidatus Aenigmarchaeota archaeon]